MMGFILKLLGGTAGPYIAGAIGGLVLLSIGATAIQSARLGHAKSDLAAARTDLRDEKAISAGLRLALKASEDKRAVEYSLAVQSAGEADSACAARVAAAHRSASAIRSILEAPHATDPQTHCPARDLVSADQLRDALQPAHP